MKCNVTLLDGEYHGHHLIGDSTAWDQVTYVGVLGWESDVMAIYKFSRLDGVDIYFSLYEGPVQRAEAKKLRILKVTLVEA